MAADGEAGDGPAHRALCPAVQLAVLPGRGRGLLAVRPVARGETVLMERPLIVVDPAKTDYRPKESIREQYTYLTDDEKVRYQSHSCMMRGSDRTVQIFYNNCVEIGRIEEYEQSSNDQTIVTNVKGFYDKFSFVNHSCGGNCAVNFTAQDGLQLVAARRLQKGEEITVNYLDPYIHRGGLGFLRAQRQAALRRCWGFRCACEVCSLEGRQLRDNQDVKRTIVAYVKKQEAFEDVQEGQNARSMFSLEVAILGEMGKLEREVLREMPECLVRCYRFGKLVQVQGTELTVEPALYLREARRLASVLGPTHARWQARLEGAADAWLRRATARIVEQRRGSRCGYYLLYCTEEVAEDPVREDAQDDPRRGL